MLLVALLLSLPAGPASSTSSPPPPPPTPLVELAGCGAARGLLMTSRGGRPFAAFLGLPYAKPPIGPLRFKAPVPAEPWQGERDATVEAPMCTQKNYFLEQPVVVGQEDCLYLNVYTPRLPSSEQVQPLLPVLVYIHGGGWFSGSSSPQLVGPQLLMDRDIVVVTLNYRLGPLGFLSTGDAAAPGNYALKDQVLALRWLRRHAPAFGGDPRAVTVSGQSAGAASAHLLLLSPVSAGLFQRVIAQSGSALDAWALPEREPGRQARRHAALVNCSRGSSTELVACLRGVDHRLLVDTTDSLKFWSVDPLTFYRPVIDPPNIPMDEVFLPKDPIEILRHAIEDYAEGRPPHHFTTIPLMMGVVRDEGILRAVPILNSAQLLEDLNTRIDELMPQLLELNRSIPLEITNREEQLNDVYRSISSQFFPSQPLSLNDSTRFIDLYSDRGFFHGLEKTAVYHRLAGHIHLFIYSFEYQGSQSYTPIFAKTNIRYGVCHCDDLLYLFSTRALFPSLSNDSFDWNVVNAMTHLWTQFAAFGHPAPLQPSVLHNLQSPHQYEICWQDVADIVWPQAGLGGDCASGDSADVPFLQISGNGIYAESQHLQFCSRQTFGHGRLAFWNSLPLVENSISKPDYKELAPHLVLLLSTDNILPGYWF
ncbi:juvenile hormone esterase-like isoform X1 [Schistocerca serialis cubense]|uniref:juvenile hormone esterase-like isoform X1 n=1 Tax=Schistocerca serialis cubense TaxID=2023355 RepID=UPI00214E9157|nr:juvenile hormone esterase-like isoform X1 [Schistocerca serialis cubense]